MLFAVILILALNCVCVTSQYAPGFYYYAQQYEPGFGPPVYIQAPQAAPYALGYILSGSMGGILKILLAATAINRITRRNIPAPTTTLPAPTTTLLAPTTTLPASTTTLPAPTTTLPASTTTLPAPTTTLPASTTTLPAPTTTLPASTTTLPPPTTTPTCSFSASLSNCGKTGTTGPDLNQCRTTYGTSWSNDPAIFNVNQGIQGLTIPESGRYRIEAYGAQGGTGNGNAFAGGKGAKMIGEFIINGGTVLNIVVGQEGSDGISSEPAGGGGGTFVYTGNIGGNGLLIAAAGGGGGGEEDTRIGFDGQAGAEAISHLGLSGHAGLGGIGGVKTSAGAGWGSDGGANTGSTPASPGTRWTGGDIANSQVGDGGFGGGASGVDSNGGGGGGGYTGGDGIPDTATTNWGGSGGGSFNAGTNQDNQTGNNSGHGRLVITCIGNV